MLEFCGEKGIKQEFSNARTPQQNGVAERMNRTLIEAARTMLADSHLPTTFWAEAVNTACYTFNRVRVTKPQNKTPYELLFGHKPILSYIRPFGCHVTILNTLSPLGKFDGKSDEGFLVGYSVNSKAFRVYNLVTKRVEVNLHVNFLEEKPNVQGIGHRWMFDLDYLTDSMNYIPVSLQNQANPAGSKEVIDIDVQTEEAADLMVVSSTSLTGATRKAAISEKIARKKTHSPKKPSSTPISKSADDIMTFRKELDALALKHLGPVPATAPTSTNPVNTGSDNLNTGFEEVTPGNIEAISPSADHEEEVFSDADDDEMPEIRIYDKSSEGIFEKASYDDDGIITDFNNLPDEVDVSTNHTLRIHNAHPQRRTVAVQAPIPTPTPPPISTPTSPPPPPPETEPTTNEYIYEEQSPVHHHFSPSQEQAPSRMPMDDLLQEVPKLISRIDSLEMDLKQTKLTMGNAIVKLVKKVKKLEEVYNLHGFVDPDHLLRFIRLVKALKTTKDIILVQVYVDVSLFGSTKQSSGVDAFEALMQVRFQMSSKGEFTFFLGFKDASLHGDQVALTKDEEAFDVDVHLYRSMIGSLMYLTTSRPDIMYAVCVCSRFQVIPKTSHLMRRGSSSTSCGKPNWGNMVFPRDSPLIGKHSLIVTMVVPILSGNTHRWLSISWLTDYILAMPKKQTIVATSTTEAEYVAAANCCGQVLWVQNQLLDYGFNFMNTKIHIDNEALFALVMNTCLSSQDQTHEIVTTSSEIVNERSL
ncbi:putative ribonuclease H-like domain-containing protein [Tanacetum coccineum]